MSPSADVFQSDCIRSSSWPMGSSWGFCFISTSILQALSWDFKSYVFVIITWMLSLVQKTLQTNWVHIITQYLSSCFNTEAFKMFSKWHWHALKGLNVTESVSFENTWEVCLGFLTQMLASALFFFKREYLLTFGEREARKITFEGFFFSPFES